MIDNTSTSTIKQLKPLDAALADINNKLDNLDADPKLREVERHKEYYVGSRSGKSPVKEEALMVCASVDENSPEYKAKVAPLIQRIDQFFYRPGHEVEFATHVRMLRGKWLIEHGQYDKADETYRYVSYGPLYSQAFEQRNKYFLQAAKNHLQHFTKATDKNKAKLELIDTLHTLQYVHEYPHGDDITLYQDANAHWAQNHFNEAKNMLLKLCHEHLEDFLHVMDQNQLLMVYKALLPYKMVLSEDVPELSSALRFTNRLERWNAMSEWFSMVRLLQRYLISMMFTQYKFHQPDNLLMADVHHLMDEPTSKVEQFQHFFTKTELEKTFLDALAGDQAGVKKLWEHTRV